MPMFTSILVNSYRQILLFRLLCIFATSCHNCLSAMADGHPNLIDVYAMMIPCILNLCLFQQTLLVGSQER